MLAFVPPAWRESVERDLIEEATRAGRRGLARDCWLAWQLFRVALRFRHRAWSASDRVERRRTALGDIGSDLRFAMRMLVRQRASSAAIVLILALGIGVSTAVYAVFNFALFRPVPGVVDPDRLVSLYIQESPITPSRTAASFAHLSAMRTAVPALSGLAAGLPADMTFSPDAQTPPRTVLVARVTAGYFQTLGVQARVGRLFSGDEYERPGALLAVLSERLWMREFNRDPAVLGRQIFINGRPLEVIGVAARFHGQQALGRDELWIPFSARRALDPEWEPRDDDSVVSSMIGRLATEATIDVAQAQTLSVFRGVGPIVIQSRRFEPVMFPGLHDGIGQTRRLLLRVYYVLMTGAALLLLLACANAGNLLLGRHLRRQRDLAVRRAIGAGRFRLARELLVESVLLAIVAGSLALGIAAGLLSLFKSLRLLSYLPVLDDLALDWRVMVFGFVLAAATVVLFALIPSLMAARVDPNAGLRDSGRVTRPKERFRQFLVSAQLALSLTLLVAAGLLTRTVQNLRSIDLGVNPDGVVTFSLAPDRLGYDVAKSSDLFRQIHDRVRMVPGIAVAAVAWQSPFGATSRQRVRLPDQDATAEQPLIAHSIAGDYFEVLGVRVLAGRTFTPTDDAPTPPAASAPIVVNEALARSLFGETGVVGRTLVTQRKPALREIVGVVADVRNRELRAGPVPMFYEPSKYQHRIGTLLIRSSLPESQVVEIVRRVVRDVDPALPVGAVNTIRAQVDTLISEERVLARLGLVLAVCAGLLAAGGLSAVVGFQVGERTREFGIRMSLGATPLAVIGNAVGRTARASAVGLASGVALAFGASRLIASRLYGVTWIDPITIVAGLVLLTGVAVLAAWLPARRAARINPTIALRSE